MTAKQRGRGAVWMAAAALLATGVLAQIVAPVLRPPTRVLPEPRFDGLTLDQWRERMNHLNFDDPGSRSTVPGLIEVVQSDQVPWFTRRQAALTLGRLGPHAATAIPVLRELLDDVGNDQDTAPQLWAIKALGLIGPLAHEATPQLIGILNDDAAGLASRLSALEALSQVGVDQPAAMSALIARVQRTPSSAADHELRRASVEVLGIIGPSASVATPALIRMLNDPDENLRRESAVSLGKLGPLAAAAVEMLLERMVVDDSPPVQDAAAMAVQQMGPGVAADLLLPLLAADVAEIRRRAAVIFGGWKRAAQPWASALRPLWNDPEPAVRFAALNATWDIEGEGHAIAPRIARLLAEDDRQVRRQAVILLTRMGSAAESARPEIAQLLNDDQVDVRIAARKALEVIENQEDR